MVVDLEEVSRDDLIHTLSETISLNWSSSEQVCSKMQDDARSAAAATADALKRVLVSPFIIK